MNKSILQSKKTEYWLLFGIVAAFVVSQLLVSPNNNNQIGEAPDPNSIVGYEIRNITVGETDYSVIIADDTPKRTQGLSFRTELPENINGMLFVFDEPGLHGIWMKDMLFDLDIFWLDDDFSIIHQELDVSPDTFPESFKPTTPASYVLELPSK